MSGLAVVLTLKLLNTSTRGKWGSRLRGVLLYFCSVACIFLESYLLPLRESQFIQEKHTFHVNLTLQFPLYCMVTFEENTSEHLLKSV